MTCAVFTFVGCVAAAWILCMIERTQYVHRYDKPENLEHLEWLP